MTCHCRTYLGAFSWLLGQRNLKRREFQGVHSLEHLQLWVIQPPVVQGSSTLPLTLGPRSLFPVHCWVFSSSPGFCPLHARSILPFAVTAKHISRYSQMSKGRLARGKIMSGSEPLCQTHLANPNPGNFPFTDLIYIYIYSGWAASSEGHRTMQTSTGMWSEQKHGEQRVGFQLPVETDAPRSLRQEGPRDSSEPSTHFTKEEIEQRGDEARVTQGMMTGDTGTTIPCNPEMSPGQDILLVAHPLPILWAPWSLLGHSLESGPPKRVQG